MQIYDGNISYICIEGIELHVQHWKIQNSRMNADYSTANGMLMFDIFYAQITQAKLDGIQNVFVDNTSQWRLFLRMETKRKLMLHDNKCMEIIFLCFHYTDRQLIHFIGEFVSTRSTI